MCFSEEASFTSAVAISVVAGAGLQMAGFTRFALLALTPLFFALQQLSEGFTWLHLKGILSQSPFSTVMEGYYSAFAFIGWPIWMPLSLLAVEKINTHKMILSLFLILGVMLAGYNLLHLLELPAYPVIASNSIRYESQIPYQEVYIYAAITLLPWFFSSLNGAWLTGSLFLFSFLVAGYAYEFTFTSIWCFFAAIVSILIFKLLMDNEEKIKAQQ